MDTLLFVKVIFDLPLAGPFDYGVPPSLTGVVKPGMRVHVTLGRAVSVGIITAVTSTADVVKVRPINGVLDDAPVLEAWQLEWAHDIASHYGCSHGQAAFMMLPGLLRASRRTKDLPVLTPAVAHKFSFTLFNDPSGYVPEAVVTQIADALKRRECVLVLVPDTFKMARLKAFLTRHLKGAAVSYHHAATPKQEYEQWLETRRGTSPVIVGMRSSVFTPLPGLGLIVMTEEGDASYQQEQTPRYQTRVVTRMRAMRQKVPVVAVSHAPSVEAVHEAADRIEPGLEKALFPPALVVDTNNYKFLAKRALSPAAQRALETTLKEGGQSLIVLNRLDTQKPANADGWKPLGIGELQKALQSLFPQARMASFSRLTGKGGVLPKADITIATQAVTRFAGAFKPQTIVLLELDASLNRVDLSGAYQAWRLCIALRNMTTGQFVVQTRNPTHPVARALLSGKASLFYMEELRVRRELAASPFGHWITVRGRAKVEKSVQAFMSVLYNQLKGGLPERSVVTEPMPDMPPEFRGQHRLRLHVQGPDIKPLINAIVHAASNVNNKGRVIMTMDVDA